MRNFLVNLIYRMTCKLWCCAFSEFKCGHFIFVSGNKIKLYRCNVEFSIRSRHVWFSLMVFMTAYHYSLEHLRSCSIRTFGFLRNLFMQILVKSTLLFFNNYLHFFLIYAIFTQYKAQEPFKLESD